MRSVLLFNSHTSYVAKQSIHVIKDEIFTDVLWSVFHHYFIAIEADKVADVVDEIAKSISAPLHPKFPLQEGVLEVFFWLFMTSVAFL